LRDAMVERHLEEALGRGLEPANDNAINEQVDSRGEPWCSPLRMLYKPPASRVKWLTAKEQRLLLNYLGGPADEANDTDDEPPDPAADSADGAWHGGLAGDERFSLSHWLTLLRADVFGSVQASIVGRLRKRAAVETAIAQAVETLDAAAYAAAANVYADLRAQLHVESLAALALLMEAGAAEAVILLRGLGGAAAVAEIVGPARRQPVLVSDDDDEDAGQEENETEDTADNLRQVISPRLMAAVADPTTVAEGAGRTLLVEAVTARRKVSRAGFRREDRADLRMAMALRAGATAIFDVINELDRLVGVLSSKAGEADLAGDTARFIATFRTTYLGGAE
jgi:hypothetical protein